jgi:hypothetical protein
MGSWKNQYLNGISVFYPFLSFRKNSELRGFQQTIDPDAKWRRVEHPEQ